MNINTLKTLLEKKLYCLLCLSSLLSIQVAQAQEDILVPASLLLRAESGVENGYLVSIGHAQDVEKTIYSGLYYSTESLTSSRKLESFGVIAYNMSDLTKSNWGGEMTASISRTKDTGYERTGFDFSLTIHHQFMTALSVFASAETRPTFLSFDSSNSELSELTTTIGLDYNLYTGINIYGQYKNNSVFSSDTSLSSLSNYFQFGLSTLF
ncbi:hypothetical protein OFY17_01010 [Marinomonas sp. C2222]|uniref:Outer membrane protein beta-barrel domain-containing protein n=1 Tax=Marinomonas sargassi TaxID=2984494 RepID=A0ABT2YNX2_9GAMM|nr:hypothetical protein [Marinomonas sargassi]MCV2401450.1 hypothetical protein [Marinomonas sargassi]